MNQELFQRDYPGIQTILNDIVYPVFGNSAAIRENILTDSSILSKAKDAGIKSATRIAEYDADGTPLNILHLRYALEVEKTGSITQAATNLFMSHWRTMKSRPYRYSAVV